MIGSKEVKEIPKIKIFKAGIKNPFFKESASCKMSSISASFSPNDLFLFTNVLKEDEVYIKAPNGPLVASPNP